MMKGLHMPGMVCEDTRYEVSPGQNSLNVKNILENQLTDLILLDLWIPVLSADQVLKIIGN